MQNANVTSNYYEGTLHFVLQGEVDHHSAGALREKMDEAIFFYRPKRVEIDLGTLSFMDSSGLGLILGRYNRMQQLGGSLVLRNPTRDIEKILRLAGVNRLIQIVQTDITEETTQ